MKNIRKILLFCLIAVICISMMACGAKNDSEVGEMAPGGTISGTGSNAIVSDSIDRKIVYTVSMRVTSKDISEPLYIFKVSPSLIFSAFPLLNIISSFS